MKWIYCCRLDLPRRYGDREGMVVKKSCGEEKESDDRERNDGSNRLLSF